jgi:Flp pilus assembly secretin CpaC
MRARFCLGPMVLVALSQFASADPPANSPLAAKSTQQIQNLRKAAEHLEKGGLNDEAAKLRQTIEAMESDRGNELLAQKEKELDALQAEVDRLRDLTKQQPEVALALTIFEVSRAKLEKLEGGEFGELLLKGTSPDQKRSGLRYALARDTKKVLNQVESLEKQGLIKVLAQPTLVTVNRRPAFFTSGGEFPLLAPQRGGGTSIEFKKWGNQVDFVPFVLGNGKVRLETRVRVSELDPARSVAIAGNTVPGLSVREFDLGYEMRLGETLIVNGNPRTVVEAQVDKSGKERQVANVIELVTLITPSHPEASAQPLDHSVRGTYHPVR